MVTYIMDFDIVPGKADEFWNFMETQGFPFWAQFDGVESIDFYTKLGGRPLYEAQIKLKDFALFDEIRAHEGWDHVATEILNYIENVQRRFLYPVRVLDRDILG